MLSFGIIFIFFYLNLILVFSVHCKYDYLIVTKEVFFYGIRKWKTIEFLSIKIFIIHRTKVNIFFFCLILIFCLIKTGSCCHIKSFICFDKVIVMDTNKGTFFFTLKGYTCCSMRFITNNQIKNKVISNCLLSICNYFNRLVCAKYNKHSIWIYGLLYLNQLTNFFYICCGRFCQFLNWNHSRIISCFLWWNLCVWTNTNRTNCFICISSPCHKSLGKKWNAWNQEENFTFSIGHCLGKPEWCKCLTTSTSHYQLTSIIDTKMLSSFLNCFFLMVF